MEIKLDASNHSYTIIVVDDNVKINLDAESREYFKTPDGKIDFDKRPKRDIDKNILEQFTILLDELIYYREAEFDSSNLIQNLFEKLPEDKKVLLLEQLNA